MTPQRPYVGQAPSAMSMMGQGFAETGANIGRLEQQGWAAMGEGVAKGMTSGAGAYASSQKAQSSNAITKNLLSDKEMSKNLLGLDDTKRQEMLDMFNHTIKQYGQAGGNQFSQQILNPIQEYAQIGRQYAQQQNMAQMSIAQANRAPYNQVGAQFLTSGANMDVGIPQRSEVFSQDPLNISSPRRYRNY